MPKVVIYVVDISFPLLITIHFSYATSKNIKSSSKLCTTIIVEDEVTTKMKTLHVKDKNYYSHGCKSKRF